jgi:NitT/TauT family transport system permease protein
VTDRQKSSSVLFPAIGFIIFLLVWEIVADTGLISSTFFPPPTKIWGSILKLVGNGELLSATAITLLRFVAGLICGSALGAILGLIMGWWSPLGNFLNPFIAAAHPITKIAIFPILMILFGIGEGSKFVAILLAAFFPMLITSLAGVQQINNVYFEVGQNYGASKRQVLTHILLPGSLPSLLAGLRLAGNTAFVITITVEIVAARSGLGVLLWFGWQTFRVGDLYAVLVVISLLGISFNLLLERLTQRFVPWLGE